MKRALFLSSAALAVTAISAPIAALDIDFSGRSRFNVSGGESYLSDAALAGILTARGNLVSSAAIGITDADMSFSNDERLHVNVSESTCCFNYGGMLRIEDGLSVKSDIYISGDWGRLDYGNLDNARSGAYDVSVVDAGPISVGTTAAGAGALEALSAGSDFSFDGSTVGDTNIVYTAPAGLLGGIGFKAATDGDNVEFGATATLGPVGMRVSADDSGRYGAMATGSLAGFDMAAWVGEDDDNDGYAGGGIAKSFGALKASLSYNNMKGNSAVLPVPQTGFVSQQDVVVGASYKIASGLTASGSVISSDHSSLGTAVRYAGRLQLDF